MSRKAARSGHRSGAAKAVRGRIDFRGGAEDSAPQIYIALMPGAPYLSIWHLQDSVAIPLSSTAWKPGLRWQDCRGRRKLPQTLPASRLI